AGVLVRAAATTAGGRGQDRDPGSEQLRHQTPFLPGVECQRRSAGSIFAGADQASASPVSSTMRGGSFVKSLKRTQGGRTRACVMPGQARRSRPSGYAAK